MATHSNCSCLENPRDRAAWWAAVSAVAQSWTRLKRLGSSSNRARRHSWPPVWLPLASSPSGGGAGTTRSKLLPGITALSSCDSRSLWRLLRQDNPSVRGGLPKAEAELVLPQQEPRLPWSCLVALADRQLSSSVCFPESRCDKDLDTLSGYALCLPNLARLQTYQFAERRPILCVEIKVSIC